MKSRGWIFCILCLCASLLSGCGASSAAPDRVELTPLAAVTPEPSAALHAQAAEEAAALHIEPRARADQDANIVYPYVYDAPSAENINKTVSVTIDRLLRNSSDKLNADYSIEYNGGGFLSLLLHLYSPDDYGQYQLYPLTFDTVSGKLYTIADLFGNGDQWRWKLPDIIAAQAEQAGITLLSSPLPIRDDQSFYLSNANLVLVYRYYEIATYTAGIPQFSIPLSELQDLATEDAPLYNLF